MRINKFIAGCGVTSRRDADRLVEGGKVKVNGKVVTEMGFDINPDTDVVEVDGKRISLAREYVYYMLNKPKGCITTANDEKDRKTIYDYIKCRERVFPIGRLDYNSEGLLLLTNDGDLAHKLTHPSFEIPKVYQARVYFEVPELELNKLRQGVTIDGYKTKPCKVVFLKSEGSDFTYEVTITEGKNRQVRKMFEAVGKEVSFLKRVQMGELTLGGLSRGGMRPLTNKEIAYLKGL